MRAHTCINCGWARRNGRGVLKCNRTPPTVVVAGDGLQSASMSCKETDWCGEWIPADRSRDAMHCLGCVYSDKFEEKYLSCKRYPPDLVYDPGDKRMKAVWPTVDKNRFCAEYKAQDDVNNGV